MTFSEPVPPDCELPVFLSQLCGTESPDWAGVDITSQLGSDNTPAG